MSQYQQIPGTPKENLRATRIVFVAIVSGAVIFAIIIFAINKMQDDLAPKTKEYANLFLYLSSAIAAFCLAIAISGYKKGIVPAKDSLIPLQDKLNIYRATLIRYIALCEGSALFSIIAFFLTGSYYLFLITALSIAVMLLKAPTRQRVSDDLALDWKQQQELE